ncbi:inter-alpha-trypsin inhibitor heavy chain H3-like [Brachyhypopomus gauderio]|uniref:inter-alpha-trypsin inhibitor heavy chain H3-like n=1 Tax=Brachyhypopomus gauderio TaxID=698409 RepID=UPI0040434290
MDGLTVRLVLLCLISFCATCHAVSRERDVDIYSFHINSTVTSRYAITVITSRVANRLNESKEIHFQVKIPKNAFISKFRMTIEGKSYDGIVKQKEEAQHQYSQAVSRGESAGIVSSVGRTLEDFKTSVTVAAFSKVTFELSYEELLKRTLGKYQLLISAQPMQPVADYKIDVYIQESPGISFLKVEGGLVADEKANAVTVTQSGKEARVNFYPTKEEQTSCEGCNKSGLNGDLLVIYDVKRDRPAGELQGSNGYFVHYFAPTDIPRIPKNVVFIIDKSGSMRGQKMTQTCLAMLKILGDLDGDDYFGLITFDRQVQDWKPELLQATEKNLEEAKTFVKDIRAQGGTDINSAVLTGVEVINSHPREGSASILILLTDGDPTSGETNPGTIQVNVQSAIKGKFPLFCLGFGFDVNFKFLEKMALENNGAARRIYEDSDADLQLQGFYVEVATPLLTHVQMNYTGVENLTQASFSQYYNGSEIVVAGQITDNSLETFQAEVIAVSKSNTVTYKESVSANDISVMHEGVDFIQRLWAYLSVKQLLDKQLTFSGQEREMVQQRALDLSLKYKFVTPLTSMVVTKPQEEETQVAHKPSEEEREHKPFRKSSRMFKTAHADSMPALLTRSHHPDPPSFSKIVNSPPMYYLRVTNKYRASAHIDRVLREPLPTSVPAAPSESGVRFIVSAQPKPICYDVPAGHRLYLLRDPSSNFSMYGELSPKGFRAIVVRYKTAQSLIINTKDIHYYNGQNHELFEWGQPTKRETDSVSLNLLQTNRMVITMGIVRVGVLRHEKDGEAFLWPVVEQPPNTTNAQSILGIVDLHYAEQGSLIKMKNQETKATWTTAIDYQTPLASTVECWLVPFDFALQGELSDFTVLQM